MNPLNYLRDPFGFGRSRLSSQPSYKNREDLANKVFLITGASKGIGEALVTGLTNKPVELITVSRTEMDSSGRRTHLSVNLDQPESLAELCQLDVLVDGIVFNAGAMPNTAPAIHSTLGLDHLYILHVLGPAWIARQLIRSSRLQKGCRIITVSSGGALPTPLNPDYMGVLKKPYNPIQQYAFHKRYQIELMSYFSEIYAELGYDFYSMHPGWVDTEGLETGMPFFHKLTKGILRVPRQGADTIEWLLCSERQAPGSLYFDRKEVSSYPLFWIKENPEAQRIFRATLESQLSQMDSLLDTN